MGNNDLIQAFVEESIEGLDSIDQDLIDLENQAHDNELINKIFRVLHSIKGTGSFFDFDVLVSIAHEGETLLDRVRNNEIKIDKSFVELLLQASEALRTLLGQIEQSETEGEEKYELLIGLLQAYQQQTQDEKLETIEVVEQAQKNQKMPIKVTESSVRVDVRRMDQLMNLVGELVLSRNQICLQTKSNSDSHYAIMAQRLSHVTTDLQEIVMQTRMQPIERIWGRYPRIVRGLAQDCQKEIALKMFGENTELDKSLLEVINDPLVHLLRNAIDHGIESPEQRESLGKAKEGNLCLKAYQEGGQIVVEVQDDGKGIDPHVIKNSACEKGVITKEEADLLTDHEILSLIFKPGFSTAAEVTDISGRGVGMDVVKEYIESAGGSVEISSVVGRGTTFQIKLPLTLAIMPSLVVRSDEGLYVIHQANLLELIHIEGDEVLEKIEYIHNVAVYRLRDKILPLVILGEALQQKRVGIDYELFDQNVTIVVLQAGMNQFGLVVDAVYDSQEVVVKPLNKYLQSIQAYSGATLLGSGDIAMILDVNGLARISGIFSEEVQNQIDFLKRKSSDQNEERDPYIMFARRHQGQMAIPMSSIARLELVHEDEMQDIGGHRVMQYQSKILPLVSVRDILKNANGGIEASGSEAENRSWKYIAVYQRDHNRVGLILGDMVDVREVALSTKSPATRQGVSHTLIVDDLITEVLDVPEMMDRARKIGMIGKNFFSTGESHA